MDAEITVELLVSAVKTLADQIDPETGFGMYINTSRLAQCLVGHSRPVGRAACLIDLARYGDEQWLYTIATDTVDSIQSSKNHAGLRAIVRDGRRRMAES